MPDTFVSVPSLFLLDCILRTVNSFVLLNIRVLANKSGIGLQYLVVVDRIALKCCYKQRTNFYTKTKMYRSSNTYCRNTVFIVLKQTSCSPRIALNYNYSLHIEAILKLPWSYIEVALNLYWSYIEATVHYIETTVHRNYIEAALKLHKRYGCISYTEELHW